MNSSSVTADVVTGGNAMKTPDAVEARMLVIGAQSESRAVGENAAVADSGEEEASAKTPANMFGQAGTGPKTNASHIKTSEKAAKSKAPQTLDELGKVPTDTVDKVTAKWNPILAAVLKLSDAEEIASHVIIYRNKPWVLGKQASKLREFFSSHQSFDLKAKCVITKNDIMVGFAKRGTMPFHHMAVICLLTGKNPNRGYFEVLLSEWKQVVKRCTSMCENDESTIRDILDYVVTKQVKKTYEHYAMFVSSSKELGMCDRKLECVKVWISKLNEDVEAYYEIYKWQQHVQSLQDIIYAYNSAKSASVDDVADSPDNWAA